VADYPDDFKKACDDLIDNWEGGYVFDPDDPGGMTKYGICARSYPSVDIKNLTQDQAVAIYYRDYWSKVAKISDPAMRAKIFNIGVLIGINEALLLARGCNNVAEYRLICKKHFEAICIKNPKDNRFLRGWVRRAMA